MSYSASKSSRKFLKEVGSKGKNESLRPPSYRPPGENILKVLIWMSFAGAIPAFYYSWLLGFSFVIAGLIFFGILDWFVQDDHAIVRIYGPMGRARYIVEDLMRDKYLQYFNENNKNGRPIPKIVRDYIYQRAHGLKSISSFGTELDNVDNDNTAHARVLHRNFRPPFNESDKSFGVEVGAWHDGIRPYVVPNAVNISGMSYGSVNYRACEAMSIGSKNVCYLNTGEGGYGPHGIAGNDVVFQIGTGKFGVGDTITHPDGSQDRVLNDQLLKELVREHDNIRMIEVKISQGAKPGKGGQLPGAKVTPEIAAVRKVEAYKPVISPAQHAEVAGKTNVEVIG
ncbi:MAG: glutamate synthase-related protein, partial [Cyclobacteriaceae bacterium]